MGGVLEPEGGGSYDDLGFAVCRDLLRPDRVAAAAREAEAMFAAMPEGTGAQLTCYEPGASSLAAMSRIDHPHLASPAILTLIRDAALASSAAGLLRSRAVQVWYCHMSRKPPRNGSRTHIGWHQDGQYTEFMQGRFITAWIPLTDVDAQSSPICYVPGSQHHGVIGGSGFSGAVDPETLKSSMLRRRAFDWNEIEVCAEPGTVVFHDSLVVHGSRENHAVRPRLTLTVHLRSERNLIAAIPSGRITLDQLRDGRTAPVIHGCREDFADMDGEWAHKEPRQC